VLDATTGITRRRRRRADAGAAAAAEATLLHQSRI